MKELSIGKQDFKSLIEGNCIYVDKTQYLYQIARTTTPYFLSRPRRFGKSLTVSTLRYLFQADRDLFNGSWIYDRWEWKKYPVVLISMGSVDTSNVELLGKTLLENLEKIANRYEVAIRFTTPSSALFSLVENLHEKTAEKVVVLIDEYDRPILNHFGDVEKAREFRAFLRNFYGVLKDLDEHLRFLFITGLTKFTKTGIFSTLNQLDDITINEDYSQMFGYTQGELEYYFREYLEKGIEKMNISGEKLLAEIKAYYDGYSFDGEKFVYNPFSILKFFREYRFKNFWIDTGQSSFLIEYAKKHQIIPEDILRTTIHEDELTTYEIEKAPPAAFLFQGGYLTFKERQEDLGYILDYPNKEVRDSFSSLLLMGSYNLEDIQYSRIRETIIRGFMDRNFEKVFLEIQRVLSFIPYQLYEKKKEVYNEEDWMQINENYYHTVILVIFHACGLDVIGEESTHLGRSDIVVKFKNDVYIIELKKGDAQKALEQIEKKEYHKKYEGKKVILIGISIDEEKRRLKEYILQIAKQ